MELNIREKVELAAYTTLHIGGVADYLVEVTSVDELKAALLFASKQTTTPPLILGGGSNVLIKDDGYRGLVIVMKLVGRRYAPTDNAVHLTSAAGEVFDEVVQETVDKNLWGLENLSAIPGSVGATPVQNVGAYGVEVSTLIKNVIAVNKKTLEEKTFTVDECKFNYRSSFFKEDAGRDWIITEVVFVLQKELSPILTYASLSDLADSADLTPSIVRSHIKDIRSGKFPDWNKVGTAGSFFKNPIISKEHFETIQKQYPGLVGFAVSPDSVKASLGWILDNVCGLRGYSEGKICLYDKQALVLVVQDGATAAEVRQFVQKVSSIVFEKTEIKIEPEVLIL